MNMLTKVLKVTWNDGNKPESYVNGDGFECFIREWLFPKEDYILLYKIPEYPPDAKDAIPSSGLPDLHFISKETRLEFFVEARFRSRYHDGALEWCKTFQLKRYQEINAVVPVLVAVGVGGKPGRPEQVFLVPMSHIQFVKLFPSLLKKYEVPINRPVSERYLQRIM